MHRLLSDYQFTAYSLTLFITTVLALLMARALWHRRTTPGAVPLALLELAVAQWAFAIAFESAATSLPSKILWSQIAYLGTASAPLLFFLFAVTYSQRDQALSARTVAWLSLVPALTILVAATNHWHHWLWTGITLAQHANIAIYGHGPWFWVFVAYVYGLLFVGVAWLYRAWFRFPAFYRAQTGALLLGSAVPLVGSMVYVSGLNPIPGLDWTPITFGLTGLVLGWSIRRQGLFKLKPVARDLLVDNMGHAMLVLDEENRVVDLNLAMTLLIGMPATPGSKPIGWPAARLPHPWQTLSESLQEQGEVQVEMALEQDGIQHYYDVQISPLKDQRHKRMGRLIVLRDITRNKETEDALRRSNRELQQRNEELDAFAHTVAHDLKNPLALLIGYSGLLEQDFIEISPQEVRARLQLIAQNSRKMDAIINELLLLSSVRKLQEVEIEPLDMAAIIQEVQTRLADLIETHRARIIAADNWPVALGRALWVEEIWANYVSNGIKYGGDPPWVELGAAEEPGGMIRFWVRDNGDGLEPEEQARLFVPFTRLHQARAEGHGLGLSIAQRIVEKLGGQVRVESTGRPGQGCTVSFTLPGAKRPPFEGQRKTALT